MCQKINNLILPANVDVSIRQRTALTRRNGVEYLKLLETKSNIEIGEAQTQLDGLFGGDDTLGNNKFLKIKNIFM